MKTKWTLLLMAGLGTAAPSALLAQGPQPLVVPTLTGTLRIQQPLPATCPDIDHTTPVTAGRIEISPAEGTPLLGFRYFQLTRASVTFAPFSIHRSCISEDVTRNYTQLGVELARAVTILGASSGPGVYDFSIPTSDVLLHQAAIVNGDSESKYRHPKEPVTGTINLELGTVSLHVVGASKVHVDPDILFGDYHGTLTADLSGSIVLPDADKDTVPDRRDNCRLVANTDQSAVASPLVRPPADVTLASCLDTAIGRAFAADLCDEKPVTLTNDAPSPFLLGGPTTVTWRAVDSKSRVGTGTQRVTVVDTTRPAFTSIPADIELTNCGPADLGLPTATDDCGGSPTFTNDAPPKFLVGVTTVTWTATDLSGNQINAAQFVTVTDTVPPTVSCVPAGPPGHTFRVSAGDDCAAPVIRLGGVLDGFVLANGERIKINETGQPGVRFIGYVGPDHIRHFHVGKGEAFVTAIDPSNNFAVASCPK